MSAQVDTVKRVYELFNELPGSQEARRNHPALGSLLELFDPDIEFVPPTSQPDRSWSGQAGRDALIEGWDDWFSAWEEQRSHPREVMERGNRVLALTDDRFRGREGIEIEMRGGAIYTFRGHKIVRIQTYFEEETARREFAAL
jgi:ketosteroid isomerase-like protein